MEFLGPVPAVWDETRVLQAKMGDYVALARRKGREWWIGAITDATARTLSLELSFLPEGGYELDAFADGVNADRWGSDYTRAKSRVDRSTRLDVPLAPGGGWAGRLRPQP
jgi:alpha-glucosidase